MTIHHKIQHWRLARRIAGWREVIATRRAIAHLDDHMREDAGLPRREPHRSSGRALPFPYLDI